MFYIYLIVLICSVVALLLRINKSFSLLALCKRVQTVNGANLEDVVPTIPGKTIFGNNFDMISINPEKLFDYCRDCNKKAGGRSFILNFLETAVYNIVCAEDAEEVLCSPTLITKGVAYDLLTSFLGTGLLISTDKKWHFRRKLLTPAFHFNILESFLEIFKEESEKFVNQLESGEIVSLTKLIPKFTLNTVCETALGVKLDNMEEGDEYRHNIHAVEAKYIKRVCNPLYFYDWIYKWFGEKALYDQVVDKVHEFSSTIINKKRLKFEQQNTVKEKITNEFSMKKKRHAMLDTLLEAEVDGLIDHKGICEEVDTFMFEGYDTTSTCLNFTLMHLAEDEQIQQKCFDEISDYCDDIQSLTVLDFSKFKYLECVIKESLRLYPSVPFIARTCVEETILGNLKLPPGAQINVHIFDMHRNPRHFPNPEKFDPDRFLAENSVNRHPFAFIPFSAGARNCIGQKFAILEMKVLLCNIIKRYILTPVTQIDNIKFESGLILRSKEQLEIKFTKRNTK